MTLGLFKILTGKRQKEAIAPEQASAQIYARVQRMLAAHANLQPEPMAGTEKAC